MNAPRSNSTTNTPNMTPMVDIVMCILIFFMLSMTFAGSELFLTSRMMVSEKNGLSSELTEVPSLPTIPLRLKISSVQKDGVATTRISTERGALSEVMPVNQVAEMLKNLRPQISENVQLVLSPDSNVPYEDVIKVYDACIEARMTQVAFAPAGT